MMKVGIDVIELERINPIDEFMDRILTESEKRYVKTFNNPTERLAGIFCAKEAVFKALDMEQLTYKEIEISHSENGRPLVILHGKYKEHFDKNYKEIDLSISHTKTTATAIAMIA